VIKVIKTYLKKINQGFYKMNKFVGLILFMMFLIITIPLEN